MKKLLSILLALTLCVGMLAGCSGSKSTTNEKTDNSANTTSSVIKLGVNADITSLDPQNHNDTTSAYMTRHIYSNLVTLNDNNEFVGDLAESWEYVDDVTVNFTLKEGVKFHNGDVLTSEDVKYTLDRLATSSKVGHLIKMVDNVEVVDDTHFTIHMNTPSNALVSSLFHSGAGILNKAHCEALEAAGKEVADEPMGTGPYKFVSWTPGTNCVLEKFDDYFDESRKAQNDGLEMKIYLEDSARTIALETGEIDLMLKVPSTDANKIRENENLELNSVTSTWIEYMGFNTSKAPFDNKLVRQAINYAVDKAAVVAVATENEGKPFDNYIGAAAIGYYDVAKKYDFNLEKAKELLKEAGYENGLEFTAILSNDTRAKSATAIQATLAEIGVTMKIEQMEASTFYEECGNGTQEAFFAGWIANAEPDNTYRALWTTEGGNNYSHYANDKILDLVNIASTSRDKQEVEDSYKEVLETISEDAVWAPLYTLDNQLAYNKDLKGVHNSPIGMHNFYALHY